MYEKAQSFKIDLPLSNDAYLPMKMYNYWPSKELLEKLYIEWPRIWSEVEAWVEEHANYYSYHINHIDIDSAWGSVHMSLSHFPEVDVVVHLSFSFTQESIFNIYLDFKTWQTLDISLGC